MPSASDSYPAPNPVPGAPPIGPNPNPGNPQPATPFNKAVAHLTANWKSTVSNALTLIVVTGAYFAAIPTAILQQHGITQNEIFWATVVCGLAKLYVGIIQKDAK